MARIDTPAQPRPKRWRALRVGCFSLLGVLIAVIAASVYMFGPFGPPATVPAFAPLTVTPALVNGRLFDDLHQLQDVRLVIKGGTIIRQDAD